ncbi:hypothetical protein EHQ46_05775 [Leptospira yanagawae]|uniref:Protein-export chaperone SecB n=1 Tax=Leptospira yanagawae TaxID=293069 RepID=A0ABY2M6Q1_9LEPT|nr:protein-export chaperone SecB [Leptospira yanagawae]TGL23145.1 hypothetical protein EHQ46_05775 [Leptospira yanagawae]
MKSDFQFLSYKVDSVHFNIQRKLGLLLNVQNFNPDDFKYQFKFREPTYFTKQKIYVSGMKILVTLPHNSEKGINKRPLIHCGIEISGAFQVEEDKLEPKTVENLVKIQIPAILLPYARSTITTLFANAGIGTFVFPLINIQRYAQSVETQLKIKIVE